MTKYLLTGASKKEVLLPPRQHEFPWHRTGPSPLPHVALSPSILHPCEMKLTGILSFRDSQPKKVQLFLKNKFIYLFIYFWLCWVFVSVRGLPLVAAIGGHSSSRCAGLSLSWPLLLRGTGPRRAGSVVVAHGPSCSAACGIFPEQGSNPCPLHWQADSQPLRHQGSPIMQY